MKDELKNLAPMELVRLVRFCSAAMKIINARLFTLLGMILCACLFAWVMLDPHWIRFAGAVAFAVLVYIPAQRMEASRIQRQTEGGQNE